VFPRDHNAFVSVLLNVLIAGVWTAVSCESWVTLLQVTVSGQLVIGSLLYRTIQLKLVTTVASSEPVYDVGEQRSSVSYVMDPSIVKAVKIRWKGDEAWSSDISISSSRVGVGHLTKVCGTFLWLLFIFSVWGFTFSLEIRLLLLPQLLLVIFVCLSFSQNSSGFARMI